jgi:hypothetical protein
MKKFHLASKFAPAFVLAALSLSLAAPTVPAQAPSSDISIKNPAEYNAYQNVATQTDAKAKASASESFLQTYPQSVLKKSVLDGLVDAYSSYDPDKTVDAAQRMLQVDPNNLKAMYLIDFIDKQKAGQAAAAKDTAKQAQLLDDAAAMAQKGLAATKPADVKDEDFKKQKLTTDALFYSILSNDALYSKKDIPAAVTAFRTELEYLAKNSPEATTTVGSPGLSDTLLLGQAYTQVSPPDMVNAVWFLARAENFAPAGFKPVIDKQARYWYKRFHGKEDGFEKVLALAATTVFPPPDFKIDPAPTPKDIADGVVASTPDLNTLALADKEYILANASKENAEKLWALLKDQVSQVPGTVLAATANQVQLAVTDDAKADKKPDFTVNMKTPLADKDIPAVGSDVTTLIGTYDSYTQSPAQIILRDGEFQVTKKPVAKKPSAAHKKPASLESSPATSKAPTAAQKAAAKKAAAAKAKAAQAAS